MLICVTTEWHQTDYSIIRNTIINFEFPFMIKWIEKTIKIIFFSGRIYLFLMLLLNGYKFGG